MSLKKAPTARIIDDHLSEDRIDLYVSGHLTEEEQAPLEEHLLLCSWCLRRAEDAFEFVDLLKEALTEAIPTHYDAHSAVPINSCWTGARKLSTIMGR